MTGSLIETSQYSGRMHQKAFWEILPVFWKTESLRPLPSPAARGSLFGLISRKHRETLHNLEVYKDKNITILYNGISLGQSELDIWVYILQKAGQRFTDPSVNYISLEFQLTQFLKAVGRDGGKSGRPGGKDKEWLIESLTRISNGSITVKTPDNEKGLTSSLITQAYWDTTKNRIVVDVNSKLGYLFSSQVTMLSVDVRTQLIGDDLALWLYNFITSHRVPHGKIAYSISNIMTRCRTETKEPRKFKYRLKAKLARLAKIEENLRGFSYWQIEGDILHIWY